MPETPPAQPIDWRERRWRQAWELHQQGLSQRQIAVELGVTQGAVSQWLKRIRDGGSVEALHRQRAPGRRCALTEEQLRQIAPLLNRGANTFGFQGDRWTTKRVAVVLKQEFGVSYHPAHISRILSKHCPGWRSIHQQLQKEAVTHNEKYRAAKPSPTPSSPGSENDQV